MILCVCKYSLPVWEHVRLINLYRGNRVVFWWCSCSRHERANCDSPVLNLNAAKWVAQSRFPLSKVALIRCSNELPRNLWCINSHFDPGSCLIPAQGNVATAPSMHTGLVGDQSKSFWVWLWVSAVCPVMDRWHVHMSSCLSPSVRWGATPACALTLSVDGNRKRMEFHRQAALFSRRIY